MIYAKYERFARNIKREGRQRILQEIGDTCLIYTGLFPFRLKQQYGGIKAMVHLGQDAYKELAYLVPDDETMYKNLRVYFPTLAQVLSRTRDTHRLNFRLIDTKSMHTLTLKEKWAR